MTEGGAAASGFAAREPMSLNEPRELEPEHLLAPTRARGLLSPEFEVGLESFGLSAQRRDEVAGSLSLLGELGAQSRLLVPMPSRLVGHALSARPRERPEFGRAPLQ